VNVRPVRTIPLPAAPALQEVDALTAKRAGQAGIPNDALLIVVDESGLSGSLAGMIRHRSPMAQIAAVEQRRTSMRSCPALLRLGANGDSRGADRPLRDDLAIIRAATELDSVRLLLDSAPVAFEAQRGPVRMQ
jgi:hypothetical protein